MKLHRQHEVKRKQILLIVPVRYIKESNKKTFQMKLQEMKI